MTRWEAWTGWLLVGVWGRIYTREADYVSLGSELRGACGSHRFLTAKEGGGVGRVGNRVDSGEAGSPVVC